MAPPVLVWFLGQTDAGLPQAGGLVPQALRRLLNNPNDARTAGSGAVARPVLAWFLGRTNPGMPRAGRLVPQALSRQAAGGRSLWARPWFDRRRRLEGFLLPLAALMSLLLLLGSLSVQAVSLQGQRRVEQEQRLREAEDQLASAAQALVARIQLQHGCLLPLERGSWPAAGCADGADLAALTAGELLGTPWQLQRWQPSPLPNGSDGGPLVVELLLALAPRDGGAALRAAFSLRLVGQPWRVLELRPLGRRGEAP